MSANLLPFVGIEALGELPGPAVLADTRWYLDGSSGRAAYESGHLPGAVFVDLDRWLAGPATAEGGRHPLPDPAVFSEAMAALGIGDDDTVIAYDDAGGVIAARLVWMLRATGRRAAILDGGLASYDGDLTTHEPSRPRAQFSVRPWPADLLAEADELTRPGVVVVDARNRDRFEGGADPVDPRPGHVPGARNAPCRENLDAAGRLLAPDAVRARFADAGVTTAENLVSYCGSGVTACHNLLSLEHLGLGRGRLYVGGWSAYGADASRPAETGPATP
ncbi:sulfurtransferase [Actinocorallia aurea]